MAQCAFPDPPASFPMCGRHSGRAFLSPSNEQVTGMGSFGTAVALCRVEDVMSAEQVNVAIGKRMFN